MSLGKLLERIFQLIPVLLGVSLIVFVMLALTPGDPVQIMVGEQAVPQGRAVVRTERLTLQPALRRAHTAAPVSLVFGTYVLEAIGLEADLNAATLRLESGVNGRFIQ